MNFATSALGDTGDAAVLWIADTGSGNRLCSAEKFHEEILQGLKPCPDIRLATANGVIGARGELDVYMPELKMNAKFLLLDKCPPVLSVGRLVEDHGFQFQWKQGCAWFTSPNGTKLECHVKNYVPMLTTPSPCQPRNGESDVNEDGAHCVTDLIDLSDPALPADDGEGGCSTPDEEDSSEPTADAEARLRSEAGSREHLLTHLPKNNFCDICTEGKIKAKPARRRNLNLEVEPKDWGDTLLADHFVVGELGISLDGEKYGILLKDLGTGMTDVFPVRRKSKVLTICSIREFGGTQQWQRFASDNAPELIAAAKAEFMTHVTSTPWRPQSNSLIEREIGTLGDGTRCMLAQSGLPHTSRGGLTLRRRSASTRTSPRRCQGGIALGRRSSTKTLEVFSSRLDARSSSANQFPIAAA